MLAFVDIEHEKQTPPTRSKARRISRNCASARITLPPLLACRVPPFTTAISVWTGCASTRSKRSSSAATRRTGSSTTGHFQPLQAAVQSGEYPVMAFCGGHQLIGMTYGADCNALVARTGRNRPDATTIRGCARKKATCPCRCARQLPAVQGLPRQRPGVDGKSLLGTQRRYRRALICWPRRRGVGYRSCSTARSGVRLARASGSLYQPVPRRQAVDPQLCCGNGADPALNHVYD